MSLEVAGDVGRTQHLATDVAGHLAFMPDHVRTQAVFGGKGRGAGRYLAFEWPLRGMDMLDMAAEMVWPRESFATDRANVGLVHAAVV